MIYTANALAEKSGATYRQIHYWTANEALVPLRIEGQGTNDGTGHRRLYDEVEFEVARGLVLMARSVVQLAPEVRRAVISGKGHIAHGFALTKESR